MSLMDTWWVFSTARARASPGYLILTAFDVGDVAPVPAQFLGMTRKVYVVLDVSRETVTRRVCETASATLLQVDVPRCWYWTR